MKNIKSRGELLRRESQYFEGIHDIKIFIIIGNNDKMGKKS